MKKSSSVVVVAVAAVGLAVGCSSEQRDAVCVDANNRVASRQSCEDDSSGRYFWYHHAAYTAGRYPTVGSRVYGGGRYAAVARGGFGSTARGRVVGG
jgi:hypothetical protein